MVPADLDTTNLGKDEVVLNFGLQSFRLTRLTDESSIRVDILGSNPTVVRTRMWEMIESTIAENMKMMHCSLLLPLFLVGLRNLQHFSKLIWFYLAFLLAL
jgi:hypothetical protein